MYKNWEVRSPLLQRNRRMALLQDPPLQGNTPSPQGHRVFSTATKGQKKISFNRHPFADEAVLPRDCGRHAGGAASPVLQPFSPAASDGIYYYCSRTTDISSS
jgi:hypothetical protein